MFVFQNTSVSRPHNINTAWVFFIVLFSLCVLPLSSIYAQPDLSIRVPDMELTQLDSNFEIPVYISDLTATIAAFEMLIQIGNTDLGEFDTLNPIGEMLEELENWTIIFKSAPHPGYIYLGMAANDNHDHIFPFVGEKVLLKFNASLVTDDLHAICDSTGAIILAPPTWTFFMNPHYSVLAHDYENGDCSITCAACGDGKIDWSVNVSDAVTIINFVFLGQNPPGDPWHGDANCDGTCNVSDAVKLINFIFIGGDEPCDTDGDHIPDC